MAHERLRPNYLFDEEKIKQLKQIAPECFEDGKINFETLKQNLGEWTIDEDDDQVEHFGLLWPGKKDARKIAGLPPEGTLEPVYGEGVKADGTPDDDGENDSKNIFIEGENLEVLKILQKSYANKVKMIYIDPPYNTGNDFVYDDDFTEPLQEYLRRTGQVDEEGKSLTTNKKSDGRFHSKWLSMMYPRLRLARNLLKDNGVILISIGDNEVNNLKLIANEIFGEEQFLSQLVWRNGRTASAHFTNEHEYILVYSKDKESLPYFEHVGSDMISDRAIKKPGPRNPYSEITFPAGMDFECEDKEFPKLFGDKEPVEITAGKLICKNRKLAEEVTIKAAWSMADLIKAWIKGKKVLDQKGQIVTRFFFKSNGILQYEKKRGTTHPKTVINEFSYKNASSQMQSLMGANPFDFTKPTDLLCHLIKPILNGSQESEIILDFFAGSGSTGHAVFQLNNDLNWNHQFLLVQLPEPISGSKPEQKEAYEFCTQHDLEPLISEITKFRLKKAHKSSGANSGFVTYKLAESNFKQWNDYNGSAIQGLEDTLKLFTDDPLKVDFDSRSLLYEIVLTEGFPLESTVVKQTSIKDNTVYGVKSKNLGHTLQVCLDKDLAASTVDQMELSSTSVFICLDSSIDDELKLKLSDKGLIKTI